MKIRKAERDDLPAIVGMLANDKLGKHREHYSDPLPTQYYHAFERINNDPNLDLIVVEDGKHQIIGTLQLTFIQFLTFQGGLRAQIEAVRIREDQRGKGIGEKLILWAIDEAKVRGAHMIQLTTDNQRPDALRFYEKLGFTASHVGLKMRLDSK